MMALPVSVVASNFSLYNNYAKVSAKELFNEFRVGLNEDES